MKFSILVLLVIVLFSCKESGPIRFSMVYDSTLPYGTKPSEKTSSIKDQYYYVYGYNESDLNRVIKTLDTLAIDTGYSFHTYRFYKYNSDLPDTGKLKKLMTMGAKYTGMRDVPGDNKFYKYQILTFSFMRHYVSDGVVFPDSYSIKFNDGGDLKHDHSKYYLRDRSTKKLVEVTRNTVFP